MDQVYDVFISYAHQDRDWVFGVLAARLREAGLRVCTDEEFTYGVDAAVNMRNAVERSRVTVPVVDQFWVDSQYAGFETLLALTGNRVIPILWGNCEIPSQIRSLSYADLRDEVSRAGRLDKLIEEVQKAARAPAAAAPSDGLQSLLRRVCSGVDLVGDFKDLHDQLHAMQADCFDSLSRTLPRLPADPTGWDEVRESSERLAEIATRLREIANKIASQFLFRLETVEHAAQVMQAGVRDQDVAALQNCRATMSSVLRVQPTRIVVNLNAAARGLLPELKRLQDLQHGPQIAVVQQRLSLLVKRHDCWQVLDNTLLTTNPDTDAETWWPDVKNIAEEILEGVDEAWAPAFRQTLQAAEAAIKAGDKMRIQTEFKSLKRRTALRFDNADTELKRLCDELRRVDGPYGFLRVA